MSVTKRSICEGDLVRVEKNGTTIEGKVWNDCSGVLMLGSSRRHIEDLFADEWTVTVIEKAKPKLPEEPGVYITAATEPDVFQLLSDGTWWLGDGRVVAEQVRHDGGNSLTKLEPVAETAKKVLGAIRAAYMTDDPTYWGMLDQIAAEFGVAK